MKEQVTATFIYLAFLFKLLFATDCGSPGIPKNGLVNGSSSLPNGATYSSGEKVIFACQGDNRKLIGDKTRTCINGSWTGTRPWCGTNIAYKKRMRVKIATPNREEVIKIPELTDGLFNNAQDSVCLPIHVGSEYVLYFELIGGPVHLLMLYVEGSLADVDDFNISGPENWPLKKTTKSVSSNSSLVVVLLENGNLEEIGELSVYFNPTITSSICEAELYAQEDPLECGQPEGVANGDVDIEAHEHMLIAGYTCHGGYQMYGNEKRHCSNTEWIGSPPVCIPTTASSAAGENQTGTPETTEVVSSTVMLWENGDENGTTNSRPASTKLPLTPTESPDKVGESNRSETQMPNVQSLPVSTTASVTEKDLDAHVSGTTGSSFIAAFVAVTIIAVIALILVIYFFLLWNREREKREKTEKKENPPITADAAQRPLLQTGTMANIGGIGCYHTAAKIDSETTAES